MKKVDNPYIDKNYIPYEDDRWKGVPAVTVKGTIKFSQEETEKAEKIIQNIINQKRDTKSK